MKTLTQFRSDTGLPIDMLTTLLDQQGVAYDKAGVAAWRNSDTREGEGTAREGKETIRVDGFLQKLQESPAELLYSLEPVQVTATILASGTNGKGGFAVVTPCPFFPCQAGQEGDRGELVVDGKRVSVVNTVGISIWSEGEIKVNNVAVCILAEPLSECGRVSGLSLNGASSSVDATNSSNPMDATNSSNPMDATISSNPSTSNSTHTNTSTNPQTVTCRVNTHHRQ